MITTFMISLIIGTFAAGIAFHNIKKISKHFLYTIDVITIIVFMTFVCCKVEFSEASTSFALLINIELLPAWIYCHFKLNNLGD